MLFNFKISHIFDTQMKKWVAGLSLGLFLVTLCFQTAAKIHSLDLPSDQIHLHLSNAEHHQTHHDNTPVVGQDVTESAPCFEIVVSWHDPLTQSKPHPVIPTQFLYITRALLPLNSPIGLLEKAPLHNNSPPRITSIQLPYFSLAPPQLS